MPWAHTQLEHSLTPSTAECLRVRVFKASPLRRSLFLAAAVALYAYVLPQCYYTAGQPRATAIAQLAAIEAAKPPEVKAASVWVGGATGPAAAAGTAPAAAVGTAATAAAGASPAAPAANAEATEEDEFATQSVPAAAAVAVTAPKTAPKAAKDELKAAFEGFKVQTEIKGEVSCGQPLFAPSSWRTE